MRDEARQVLPAATPVGEQVTQSSSATGELMLPALDLSPIGLVRCRTDYAADRHQQSPSLPGSRQVGSAGWPCASSTKSGSHKTLRWRKVDSNLYGAFPCQGAFSRGWHLIANCCLTVLCSERERPFFVPSPAIRFPERAEGVKGPKR